MDEPADKPDTQPTAKPKRRWYKFSGKKLAIVAGADRDSQPIDHRRLLLSPIKAIVIAPDRCQG